MTFPRSCTRSYAKTVGPVAPDQEAVWVPLAHRSLGINSIRDPDCALTADRGNRAQIDLTRLGRIYAATAVTGTPSIPWPGSVRDILYMRQFICSRKVDHISRFFTFRFPVLYAD